MCHARYLLLAIFFFSLKGLKTFEAERLVQNKEAGWVHMVIEPTGDHSIGRLPQSQARVSGVR